MTLLIADEDRIKYLWYFLIHAADKRVIISGEILFSAFSITEIDLQIISDTCKQVGVSDVSAWVAGRGTVMALSPEMKQKLITSAVSPFQIMPKEESPFFNFLMAKYCAYFRDSEEVIRVGTKPENGVARATLIEAPESSEFRTWSAFKFWETLDWGEIKGPTLDQLSDLCFKIFDVNFVNEEEKSTESYKKHEWLEIPNFLKFTSEHAYLIIHQRDFSETLGKLRELEEYYREEQATVEGQKSRTDDLFANVKSDLEKKAEESIEESKIKANELVDEAKKRYSENLVAGYVEKFNEDAAIYQATAFRWFVALVVSFLLTLIITAGFLGEFTFGATAASPSLKEDLRVAFSTISLWTLLAIGVLMAAIYISRNSKKLFNMVGLSTLDVNSVLENLKFSLNVVLIGLPVILFFYILTHYFRLEISSPSITAASFLIPEKQNINWAALLSGAAPRVILLLLASGVTAFCAKMYKIQKHLETASRYRATALASFRVFVDTMGDAEDAKSRKEKLFDELANLIYTPIQTGFHEEDKLKTSELANLVAAAASKIVK